MMKHLTDTQDASTQVTVQDGIRFSQPKETGGLYVPVNGTLPSIDTGSLAG